MRRQSGLSMVTILIALAVVGILGAIAVPTYASYTRRVYIGEGLELAMPAKADATEYHELAKSRVTPVRIRRAGTVGDGGIGLEVVMANPSRNVEAILRYQSLVVVSYARSVDPEGRNNLYLVLAPSAADGATVWSCLSGDAAAARLNEQGLDPGDRRPMPTELASAVCR